MYDFVGKLFAAESQTFHLPSFLRASGSADTVSSAAPSPMSLIIIAPLAVHVRPQDLKSDRDRASARRLTCTRNSVPPQDKSSYPDKFFFQICGRMEEKSLPRFSVFQRWPNILLILIITIVSVAVVLLLLPYIVRDKSSFVVSSVMLYRVTICMDRP